MATFKAIALSQENHIKNDGTSNIKIRIYHERESQYISTKFYVKSEFLGNSGEVSQECPSSDELNFEIGEIIQSYRKLTLKLGSGPMSKMSCKELKAYILEASEPTYETIDFIKFCEAVIARNKKFKTAEWYGQSISVLKWFYGKDVIDVRDITSSKLNALMVKLSIAGQKGKPLQAGAIGNYLSGIRALFNLAKLQYNDEDLGLIRIPHDPFAKIEIPKYKRKRKNIGVDEIKKIRDGVYQSERENIGRDVFLIQFYLMGININDLFHLKPPVNGRLEYERSKTNTDENLHNFMLSIKIEPELQVLIDKYSPDGFLSTLRSRYSCSYNIMKSVNKGLKKICADLGYTKITSNWARHSWASLARNKASVEVADIDFCLGHVNKDYKMADIYIEIDYSIYDKSNRKVLDLLINRVVEKEPEKKGFQTSFLRVV